MHKILYASFLVLFFNIGFAQENNQITISFENDNIVSAFSKIEKITGRKFYFAQQWIPEKTFTKDYLNEDIEVILSDLLKGTLLNYYEIDDHRIILTQNSIIYDKLPDGFFPEVRKDSSTSSSSDMVVLISAIFYTTLRRIQQLKQ